MPRQWHTIAVKRADSGPSQAAVEIVCSVCGKTDHAINPSNRKALPQVWVENYFAQKGWDVGRKSTDDRCPACAAAIRAERRTNAETKQEKTMAANKAPVAEPPRQMGFQEKPIILAKLVEVYVDPDVGYDRGWSDKRVAEDLGVPRAWVAELREQNFGPARDNEEIREILALVAAAIRTGDELTIEAVDIGKRISALSEQVKALSKAADVIRKAVA